MVEPVLPAGLAYRWNFTDGVVYYERSDSSQFQDYNNRYGSRSEMGQLINFNKGYHLLCFLGSTLQCTELQQSLLLRLNQS